MSKPMLIKKIDKSYILNAKRIGTRKPVLLILLLSDDPASAKYVEMKTKACAKYNIGCEVVQVKHASYKTVENIIHAANHDDNIKGIMIQHPFDYPESIFDEIAPEKDVDGVTSANMAKLQNYKMNHKFGFLPATVAGIRDLLDEYSDVENMRGRIAVVVGRSRIVGSPLAMLLRDHYNMTVINCHSKTRPEDIKRLLKTADFVFTAAGNECVKVEDIKAGSMVFDAGFRKDGDKFVGDIDGLQDPTRNSHLYGYTPLIGSIGPMTIQSLIGNVLTASKIKSRGVL